MPPVAQHCISPGSLADTEDRVTRRRLWPQTTPWILQTLAPASFVTEKSEKGSLTAAAWPPTTQQRARGNCELMDNSCQCGFKARLLNPFGLLNELGSKSAGGGPTEARVVNNSAWFVKTRMGLPSLGRRQPDESSQILVATSSICTTSALSAWPAHKDAK
eukprot:1497003-Amphidinium_carterae.2